MSLTKWCVSEFLPPSPRNLPHAACTVAAADIPRLLLTFALLKASQFQDIQRSNDSRVAITEKLEVTVEEYDDIMSAIIEVELEQPIVHEYREQIKNFRRLTVKTAFLHQELSVRFGTVLAELGISKSSDFEPNATALSALVDSSHPQLINYSFGPWMFLRTSQDGEPDEAHYIPDFLFHSSAIVRNAAMKHLFHSEVTITHFFTPNTLKAAEELTPDITHTDNVKFRTAARALVTAMSKDFLFALARLHQAHGARWEEEINVALRQLLEPRIGLLESIPITCYSLPRNSSEELIQI
ncbi:MAG: hypothetical protein R3B84_13375 [Zavarzinella sp.]